MERLSGLISEARRDGRLVALIYVNLDGLNRVNDALGHHGGDRVLVETAQRLRQLLQPADALARLGGDEFLIISSRFMVMAEAEALARQILDACSQAFLSMKKTHTLQPELVLHFIPAMAKILWS